MSSWVATPTQQAAFALDAADGRIDGKYFGSNVGVAVPAVPVSYGAAVVPVTAVAPVTTPAVTTFTTTAPVVPVRALPLAGAVVTGPVVATGYGAPVTGYGYGAGAPVAVAGSQAGALSLDLADGRLDGKYHGAPVVSATPF